MTEVMSREDAEYWLSAGRRWTDSVMRSVIALHDENAKLRDALVDARHGMEMASQAVERGFTDEALLHLGAHHARAGKALQ